MVTPSRTAGSPHRWRRSGRSRWCYGLTDEVLDICNVLSGQTIEKLLAMSDLEVGLDALKRLGHRLSD
jgi:hypothetical protein